MDKTLPRPGGKQSLLGCRAGPLPEDAAWTSQSLCKQKPEARQRRLPLPKAAGRKNSLKGPLSGLNTPLGGQCRPGQVLRGRLENEDLHTGSQGQDSWSTRSSGQLSVLCGSLT